MAIQSNITNDLSTISRVPVKILTELNRKECLCIGSAIHDAIIANEDIAVLNIGIGTLSIEISTKQCKFIPSKELRTAIKKSINEKTDPVELEIEKEIVDKLLNICNEVL